MLKDIQYFAPALGANKKKVHSEKKKSSYFNFPYSKHQTETAIRAMKEQTKIKDYQTKSIHYRDDYIRAQNIINRQMERSRLMGVHGRVIGNLRYIPAPIRSESHSEAPNRLAQVEAQLRDDAIPRPYDMLYNRFNR